MGFEVGGPTAIAGAGVGCVLVRPLRSHNLLLCGLQVAEQLFRPLVFQLVHWFTGNTQYESPDTVSLLEAFLVRADLMHQ